MGIDERSNFYKKGFDPTYYAYLAELEQKQRMIREKNENDSQNLAKSLTATELGILESVLESEIRTMEFLKNYNMDKFGKKWFELASIDFKDYGQQYTYLLKIAEKVLQLRSKRNRVFFLPKGYETSTFDGFEIQCDEQETAWNLLAHFGPEPPRGLYLYGGYGTGKTHLISAFSRCLLAELTAGYIKGITVFVRECIQKCEPLPKKEFENYEKNLRVEHLILIIENYFNEYLDTFQKTVYQPTDLAFATFDFLYDRRENDTFITDFLSRRIVIIDDIHPKGDRNRLEFIQRIIEYRYNEVRTGATFVTSNLSPEELLINQDYPKEVSERVHSRLEEMTLPIKFAADDYRLRISAKANNEMLELARQLAAKKKKSTVSENIT